MFTYPKPIRLRGAQMLSGYAAARRSAVRGLSPGSIESRVPALGCGCVVLLGTCGPGWTQWVSRLGQAIVNLTDRKTNRVVALYRPTQDSGLQVTLSPSGRVTSEGRWSISGQTSTWTSGTTLDLLPCEYQVSFMPVDGYVTPAPRTVGLIAGQTHVLGVSYRPLLALGVTAQGRLRMEGAKGATYQIQARPDLSARSDWSNAWTVTLTSETNLLNHDLPTNGGSFFYRAVRIP